MIVLNGGARNLLLGSQAKCNKILKVFYLKKKLNGRSQASNLCHENSKQVIYKL